MITILDCACYTNIINIRTTFNQVPEWRILLKVGKGHQSHMLLGKYVSSIVKPNNATEEVIRSYMCARPTLLCPVVGVLREMLM